MLGTMNKKYLTVHATMTPPDVDMTKRDIDRRDRQSGFAGIGFHYVIRRDGTVEPGRDLAQACIHDEMKIARDTIGVCLVGGLNADSEPTNNFTETQLHALRLLIRSTSRSTSRSSRRAWTTHDLWLSMVK
jgi:N-acetylmuramoyl-L-alanine amidase